MMKEAEKNKNKTKKFVLFKGHNASLVNHIFQILLVTYLILLLAEQVWAGIVSVYLNLNYLLIAVIIAGVLDVFSEHVKKQEKIKKRDYFFIILLGIAGFAIIKFKTSELGWLSWIISVIAGILIILLSLLVLDEDDDEKENSEGRKGEEKIEKSKEKKVFGKLNWILLILLILCVISIALTYFTSLSMLESLRIVFGSVFVLFIPGFILSYIFFPRTRSFEENKEEEKGSIDWIERIALSFALSIAVVPLIVFYLNLIGVKISLLNSFLTILGIIGISCLILVVKFFIKSK